MFTKIVDNKQFTTLKDIYNIFYHNLPDGNLKIFLEREKNRNQLYRFCNGHVLYEVTPVADDYVLE